VLRCCLQFDDSLPEICELIKEELQSL
jgi:hypothetical protein